MLMDEHTSLALDAIGLKESRVYDPSKLEELLTTNPALVTRILTVLAKFGHPGYKKETQTAIFGHIRRPHLNIEAALLRKWESL